MRKKISATRGAALMLGGAVLTVSGQAVAANCPTGSNVVYVDGSSAFQSVLQAAQNVLGSEVQIIYQSPGSCEGLQHLVGDMGSTVQADTSGPKLIAPGVAAVSCTLASGSAMPDIGISDVYPTTCSAYDANLNAVGSSTMTKDFLGPIQAMTIAVPVNSIATSISAEAAYMVFRYAGATGMAIAPWNIPTDIFTRYYDSGTLEMIGLALGNGTTHLPGGNWANATCSTPGTSACPQTVKNTPGMVSALQGLSAQADMNAGIGIVAAQSFYGETTVIKPLAFQASGQSCGYYPDSALNSGDKLNVRQGRYAIWGPEHLVVNVDTNGNPLGLNGNTAAVQTLIGALTSTSQAPVAASGDAGTGLTDSEVASIIASIAAPASGIIPQCAMQVQRSAEDGAESSYMPQAPCDCAFMAAATGSAPGCTPCGGDAGVTCSGSTPVCRFGFCEAQ